MRRFGIVFTAVVFFSLLAASQSHATTFPKLEWVRTYDSPAHKTDIGYGVDIDNSGYVYIAGTEYRSDLGQYENIWLRKYDPNGNTIWTLTHNGNFGSDFGQGVAVDAEKNIYVVGREDNLSTESDVWVRKYDKDRNILWTRTYDGTDDPDWAFDIALDQEEYIYVIGYETNEDARRGIWLRKYDNNGNTIWTRTHYSPSSGHENAYGYSVAVDKMGNVYATGLEYRADLNQNSNIWLRKYDPEGNTIWTRTHDSPYHVWDDGDEGRGVTVDAMGNIYVIGREAGEAEHESFNIWLRKYDTNGNTLWTQTYDSPHHRNDFGFGVAVDEAGYIYATGTYDTLYSVRYLWLCKYTPDGDILWTETYHQPDSAEDAIGYDIALDSAGNIYVVGAEGDYHNSDNILLLKYSQVPEPGTIALISAALLGFAGVVFKRRK